ncbi:hypothetical protein SAZ11_17435 [Streptomyces sp. FXJ1.4098]|uniref:hypothetical protein n=1 Tax=Streptomyces sp. NPDC020845 TaxID=3365096 RepID=UPI002990E3CA|nr:hypothetical protein [Streptomyces sp. FXJ1.4098]
MPTGFRLFTALLLRESVEAVRLLPQIHHLIVDGWSLNLVSTEMWAEYARLTNRLRPPSSGPAIASADIVPADTDYPGAADLSFLADPELPLLDLHGGVTYCTGWLVLRSVEVTYPARARTSGSTWSAPLWRSRRAATARVQPESV